MLRTCLSAAVLIAASTTLLAQTSTASFELQRNTHYFQFQGGGQITSSDAAVSGDFNNDAKPDLIVAGGATSNSITLLRGNGDGTFQAPVTVGTAQYPSIVDMVAADVNGDGNVDLVVASVSDVRGPAYLGNFQVFLGYGNGTFEAPMAYTTKNPPVSIAVRDFNGDGHPDIAVGEQDPGVVEIWNNEGVTFTLAKTLTPIPNAGYIEVRAGHFGGAGNDLAAAGPNSVYVLWNDGHENFAPEQLGTYFAPNINGVVDMSVGTLNMDGRDDVLVSWARYNQTKEAPGGIDVYYGQGYKKMFKRTVETYTFNSYGPSHLLAVDVNGDGVGDIVADPPLTNGVGAPSGLYVWFGKSDGSFSQTPVLYLPTTHGSGALVAGDFNRDGMMGFAQILPSDRQLEIYINAGSLDACSVYTINPTVTVCGVVDQTYLPNGVTVDAHSYDKHQVTAIQEYIDNKLAAGYPHASSFIQRFQLDPGPHFLVTKAWDSTGLTFVSDRTITVYNGTPAQVCPVRENSAAICLPPSSGSRNGVNSTFTSPVHILANGWTSNVPTAAQLYIDYHLVVNDQACDSHGENCDGGTSYLDTMQNLSKGNHLLVFKLWDSKGHSYSASRTVTVQ